MFPDRRMALLIGRKFKRFEVKSFLLNERKIFPIPNHQDELKIYAHQKLIPLSTEFRTLLIVSQISSGLEEIEQSGSISEISLVSICVSGIRPAGPGTACSKIERKNHDLCKFLFSQSEKKEE